jgi:hypothetical protein
MQRVPVAANQGRQDRFPTIIRMRGIQGVAGIQMLRHYYWNQRIVNSFRSHTQENMHPRWVCEKTGSFNPQVASYNLFEQNIPRLWWETEKLKSDNEAGSLCPYTRNSSSALLPSPTPQNENKTVKIPVTCQPMVEMCRGFDWGGFAMYFINEDNLVGCPFVRIEMRRE